jgi:hypothetical protein
MKRLVLLAATWLLSCGGDVVVDDSAADDTASNASGASGSSAATSGDPPPNPCFSVPEVAGAVDPATCFSDGTACSVTCNDGDNHGWKVSCFEQACQCIYDNEPICLCSVTGSAGTICGGNLPPCCPAPWINP